MTVRIYVDGSALCRYLPDVADGAAWRAWAHAQEPTFLVSPLSLLELRRVADAQGPAARTVAYDVMDRLPVERFSDQALARAATVTSVLSPFGGLHLGIAVTFPDVTHVATYDARLAAVATLHGLAVETPGREPSWWDRALQEPA